MPTLIISGTTYSAIEAWISDIAEHSGITVPTPQFRAHGRGHQVVFDIPDEGVYRYLVWGMARKADS